MRSYFLLFCLGIAVLSCSGDSGQEPPPDPGNPEEPEEPQVPDPLTDEEIMDLTQETTFRYFWDFAEANSGAARERYHPDDPGNSEHVVATGGSGFGLMAILVGIERGFISRSEGIGRLTGILEFFENADRFHGAWPHWINGADGSVLLFSDQDNGGDLVETAFFAQGLICVKEYFKDGPEEETALADKADLLWKGIEWDWYTQDRNTLYWHWSPDHGFAINLELKGYNETLIAYVLGAASPGHTIPAEAYHQGWAGNGDIVSGHSQYGFPLVLDHAGAPNYGGPLFWAHYSYLGLNPMGLSDQYADYRELNVSHSNINYRYCVENPNGYTDYGPDCWGLTASYTRQPDGTTGYSAHKPASDTGVISPTAAISSIPYTPEESLAAMHFFYSKKDILLGPAGFYDAFSPEYGYWVAEAYLAIDQGPQIIMIENYRSGLLWNLFMRNEDVRNGLTKLGFTSSEIP
ncbi:glucoamylase family protein [Sinomicrobium soli]|uniref:glucoamylase family protein n=1 Tax=Sinomicrobium sp. N-1-3-6 TaxID=2219864 RepID=UPI000DCB0847|nr:glucoamylase family protein [Sinomicrobium sp. N-1-3-6]RAV28385.1 beta-glucosidase [Sinomicrobium sp. N-1-3-6]